MRNYKIFRISLKEFCSDESIDFEELIEGIAIGLCLEQKLQFPLMWFVFTQAISY